MKLVAGNSNRPLAEAISGILDLPLTKSVVRRFADMEVFVEVQENMRGEDVYVLQSTSFPANDNLMELLILVDALKRSMARRITAVMPYFGYARQDRRPGPRTPISAKLVANLIERAGVDRVMTVDLHAGQIQGFFDIPTDNLFAAPTMVRDIQERYGTDNLVVVSPDVGGVVRARALAKRIGVPIAICDKRRERPGEFEVMNVIGDVDGKRCVLIDDIVDSGGTLVNAANALLEKGATEVVRLHHPWRADGRGGGQALRLQHQDAHHHGLDPAHRRHHVRPQHPRPLHRPAAGRGHRADGARGERVEPVLLRRRRAACLFATLPPPTHHQLHERLRRLGRVPLAVPQQEEMPPRQVQLHGGQRARLDRVGHHQPRDRRDAGAGLHGGAHRLVGGHLQGHVQLPRRQARASAGRPRRWRGCRSRARAAPRGRRQSP